MLVTFLESIDIVQLKLMSQELRLQNSETNVLQLSRPIQSND